MAEKTYIATAPLFVGTARAHNPGDEVPAENVERHGWKESVVGSDTKSAKEILERLGGAAATPAGENPSQAPATS